MKNLEFDIVKESLPGEKFSQLFQSNWSAYKAWYLDEGEQARPTYMECIQALQEHMPELYPVYRQILRAVEADDLQSRFLSLYQPPPFYSGCSQLIYTKETPLLIRNYDFPPLLCEGVIFSSQWLKKVIAMTDCSWGALDGINEDGLAISLAYGGRLAQGDGFGVTLVLRYILETCKVVDEAVEVLKRIPIHLDYNIAILDRLGGHANVEVAPGHDTRVTTARVSTNHQADLESLSLPDSKIRMAALEEVLGTDISASAAVAHFLQPPLYRSHKVYQSGTLYTSVYSPESGTASYLWPHQRLDLSFENFNETQLQIFYE